jgi:hypothetical protein
MVCKLLSFLGNVAGNGRYVCVGLGPLLFQAVLQFGQVIDRDFRYPDRADYRGGFLAIVTAP